MTKQTQQDTNNTKKDEELPRAVDTAKSHAKMGDEQRKCLLQAKYAKVDLLRECRHAGAVKRSRRAQIEEKRTSLKRRKDPMEVQRAQPDSRHYKGEGAHQNYISILING